ncbi:MAG TPA: glycosyltransferase family 39 protein [Vitreimonas sp.]|nr:glycosyltransferase family 39 protein [Vitreimonas sp.]
MSKRAWWISIIFILCLSLSIRFYHLGQVPVGLYWDEIAMLTDAKSVAESGLDMHGRPWFQVLYPSYGDYKLPVYIWLASLMVKIFGISEWALRLPSAVAGVATVALGGLLMHEIWKWSAHSKQTRSYAPLFAMLITALAPWAIMFSRTGFEGHLGQALLGLSIWVAMKATTAKQPWWWLLGSAVLGALATYTYFSVRFVWPVVVIATQLLGNEHLFTKRSVKVLLSLVAKVFLPLLVFAVLLWPMLRSPLYADSNRFRLGTDSVLKTDTTIHTGNFYKELSGNSIVDRLLFHRGVFILQALADNYSDNVSDSFKFIVGDPNLRHGTGEHGLFYGVWLLFFVVGCYALARDNKRGLLLLIGWWVIALLPASVPENTPHALRSLNALLPLVIILGSGAMESWQGLLKFKVLSSKFNDVVLTSLFVLLFFVVPSASFLAHYFTQYPQDSATAWQDQYKELAVKLFEIKRDRPVYVLKFDDRFYLWLMAYGPYTARDFHTWKSDNYQFRELDTFYFDVYPTMRSETRLVVGEVGRMSELEEKSNLVLKREAVIYDHEGQPKFIIASVEGS